MTYENFVKMLKEDTKSVKTRFDAICYCIGFFGEITQETFDMIQKMHYQDKLLEK